MQIQITNAIRERPRLVFAIGLMGSYANPAAKLISMAYPAILPVRATLAIKGDESFGAISCSGRCAYTVVT